MVPLLKVKNAFIATEAARILCAIDGVWVSEGVTSLPTPSKVTAQIGLARQQVFERMEAKRAKRKASNRRAYLRRRIEALTQQETNETEIN